jgi:hypothetical protein
MPSLDVPARHCRSAALAQPAKCDDPDVEDAGFLAGARTWLYGSHDLDDRCDRCGFEWTMTPADALALITQAPARYAALLDGRDGMAPAADGGWNATSYVWHLADLARGWSERWVLLAREPGALLAGWDPDELAAARNYRALPTVPALWALSTCTTTLVELTRRLTVDTPFAHGDWGRGTAGEAVVWLAHEFTHHQLDVDERARPAPPAP